MASAFILKSQRVVLPQGVQPAAVHVKDGVITDISDIDAHGDGPVTDLGNAVLMPGLVDSHVHINEPGRTHWEGFQTATRAAISGGVTTVVDMPLNSIPPTTTMDGWRAKVNASKGKLWCDTGLLGGVIPGNTGELEALVKEGGVLGFKSFLVHSGVDEFPHTTEDDVREAMKEFAGKGCNTVYMFHAEVPAPIDDAVAALPEDADPCAYETFLATRPKQAENEAIDMVIRLCREMKGAVHCHIVHLSSADAVEQLRAAQAEGLPITVETCTHYLHFTAEEIARGHTQFKCCPPIRGSDNRAALWKALKDGVVDTVISDHSPADSDLKCLDTGDFTKAWGGISSLQLRLPITWTGASEREHTLNDLANWVCTNPAKLVGIADRKGSIAVGKDADFVVWDPDAEWTVQGTSLHHRHPITPYDGLKLRGVVDRVFLRGREVVSAGKIVEDGGAQGRLVTHRK